MKETYTLRTCYVNFAEHLQNTWNVNLLYEDAPGTWTAAEWKAFFEELNAFGFTNFQFWIPPTLCKPGSHRDKAVLQLNEIIEICHQSGLSANPLIPVNTIGAEWYFACPNDPDDRSKILEFWTFFAEHLCKADIFTVFPGDPGGCNRNGCTHNTFIELAAELAHMLKRKIPDVRVEIGTWGTPFTGWGDDMRHTPGWDGSFAMLVDPNVNNPEIPCHIWNGSEDRVKISMQDLIDRLPLFPADTLFSLNSGFNPDCEPIGGYDARPWVKKIAKTHKVTSWDYAASEGELICYPHYRLEKYKRKRLMETETAPYCGAICYTMSPKLNQLMLYSAAQLMIDPQRDAVELAEEFSEKVFGDKMIGRLMKAFEIVPGWGYEPTGISKADLIKMLEELSDRLTKVTGYSSSLPIFPSAEEYRQILLWHAENFKKMLGDNPNREVIRQTYWKKALSIYDHVPKAVDERSAAAANGYSRIGIDL